MASVFLTASFKLHQPSTRKRNAMLQAMSNATAARAALYAIAEEKLEHLLNDPASVKPAERKREVSSILAGLRKTRESFGAGGALLNYGLRDGVLLDVKALLLSRLSLLAGHDDQAGGASLLPQQSGLEEGLYLLRVSTSKEQEDVARDLMAIKTTDAYRPLRFTGWRTNDGFVIMADKDKWYVWMPIGKLPVDRKNELVDIRTGEVVKLPRTPGILVPLEFGASHQARIITHGIPRSSVLRFDRETNEFYLNVAVEMTCEDIPTSSAVVGVDRGIEVVAAYAVRDQEHTLETGMIDGTALREIQRKQEALLKESQKSGKKVRLKWRKYVDRLVHETANAIVNTAKKHQASVILEDLKNIQNGPARRKMKGAIRTSGERNLNKQLSRAVYARLKTVLDYKLRLRGLPSPKSVFAGGTSITCPACGHKDRGNRASRNEFKCLQCAHTAHADINAAINIAARGQKFLAGGKRRSKEGGIIVPSHATGGHVYESGTIAPCVPSGAKDVTQVQKTEPNGLGTESKCANFKRQLDLFSFE